jgi:hypothetical protein
MRVTFQDLAKMPTEELGRTVAEMARAMDRPPNGEIKHVEEQIATLERKHGLSSDELRR